MNKLHTILPLCWFVEMPLPLVIVAVWLRNVETVRQGKTIISLVINHINSRISIHAKFRQKVPIIESWNLCFILPLPPRVSTDSSIHSGVGHSFMRRCGVLFSMFINRTVTGL
ncbi:MAG: hypothetical protein PHQ75_08340 [Thermoguttaceae bacterium]|nr:hypothetical protein [Thermoguttaceae bacterium]